MVNTGQKKLFSRKFVNIKPVEASESDPATSSKMEASGAEIKLLNFQPSEEEYQESNRCQHKDGYAKDYMENLGLVRRYFIF